MVAEMPGGKATGSLDLEPYLARLRALPFVADLRIEAEQIALTTPEGMQRLHVSAMRGVLSYARVNSLIARRSSAGPWILFAPHVSPGVANQIAKHGGNFVDAAGNCHVAIADRYLVHVEGKRPARQRTGHTPLRGPGLQVLLALLVDPDLAKQPVRTLAERAGASKSTASNVLRQLRSNGSLVITKRLVRVDDDLWDTFATGYAASLRPSWLIGRFRAQGKDLDAVEKRLAGSLGEERTWAWGGGAAADRMIQYFHGPTSAIHLAHVPAELPRELRLLKAVDGPFILLRTPCPAAFSGPIEHVVAPALVYAELVCAGDERALETAAMIRERYAQAT